MNDPIPTRKEVSDAMEDGNWAGAAFAVAAAYVEGRLVDREAVDYEAAIYEWFDGQSLFAKWSDTQVRGYAIALAAAIRDIG